MTNAKTTYSPPAPRWLAPSFLYSFLVLALGAAVWGIRIKAGPWAAVAAGLPIIVVSLWLCRRATLYPRIYRGYAMALAGLLMAFTGVNQSVGVIGYEKFWRRAFHLGTDYRDFRHQKEKWVVQYPSHWAAWEERTPETQTFMFKPSRLTLSLMFSVTRKPLNAPSSVEQLADQFLMNLPKSGQTQILERRAFDYPDGRPAFELVYEDPTQTVPLRNRVVFVIQGGDLFMLSASALPGGLARLTQDADRFLLSLRTAPPI